MNNPATLRRRITLYERYLVLGLREPLATQFRELIAIASAELRALECRDEDAMLYVVRFAIETGSEIRESFEVYSKLADAESMYMAARSRMRPHGPIRNRALYGTNASDSHSAIKAVKLHTALLPELRQGFQAELKVVVGGNNARR